jgi:hypothetical protein
MRLVGMASLVMAVLSSPSSSARDLFANTSNGYRKLTCIELAQEGRAISKKGFILSGLKAGSGGSDESQTDPAVVLVWPAVAQMGDTQRSEKLALAAREMDALEQASIESQCSIRFKRPSAS